jgi:UPF0755 protein
MKWVARIAATLAVVMLVGLGAAWWWLNQPLPLARTPVELAIEPGDTPREVAANWVQAGVVADSAWLYGWFRISGDSRRIRAGSYQVDAPISPRQLLAKLVQGDEAYERLRMIEGWTFPQLRAELARAPNLRNTSATMSDAALMAAIGASAVAPEGRFFPDTYVYSRGVSDLAVLRRAYRAMQRKLDTVWAGRAPDLPLKSADDALVLASIVEKETGRAADRRKIAAVFVNRLRLGMPLQTDPTVIYGLGERYNGKLYRRDLLADTPFNTYTRAGLPPTPIAMPGLASLRAAVTPDPTSALYFVARGDGSSEFSDDLGAHNRAVDRFIRSAGR